MKLNASISFSLILSLVRKQSVTLPCLKHQNQTLENLKSFFLQKEACDLKPYLPRFPLHFFVLFTYSLAKTVKSVVFFSKTLTVNVPQGWLTAYSTIKARSQFPWTLAEAKSPYFSVMWGVINQRPFISPTTRTQICCKIPTESPIPPTYSPGSPPPPRGRHWQVHNQRNPRYTSL